MASWMLLCLLLSQCATFSASSSVYSSDSVKDPPSSSKAQRLCEELLPKPHFCQEESEKLVVGDVVACLVGKNTKDAIRLQAAIESWLPTLPGNGQLIVFDVDGESSLRDCEEKAAELRAFPVIFQIGSVTLGGDSEGSHPPQTAAGGEHSIEVTNDRISLQSPTEHGLFHALQTLRQIHALTSRKATKSAADSDNQFSTDSTQVPRLRIVDWPDILNRGIMLDISRNKVPRLSTLKLIVELLASVKINQLQLYTEHTFAFPEHKEVWRGRGSLSPEEAAALSAHAHQHFIELVPNQQSFGHMQHWLKVRAFQHLAEAVPGSNKLYKAQFCCSDWDDPEVSPYSLAPGAASLAFLSGLYKSLLPSFPHSDKINVGLDEVYDLGDGKSREAVRRRGAHTVYLHFVKDIVALAGAHNRSAMFWGDVIANNQGPPPKLPESSVIMDWGYEANAPFKERGAKYMRAGLRYYVCPGTSAWLSLGGRVDNSLRNILNAAVNGFRFNAEGLLATDWGDHGHLQTLPVSLPGFLAAADFSWNTAAGVETMSGTASYSARFADAVDSLLLRTSRGSVGKVVMAVGNVFQQVGRAMLANRSALFNLLLLSNKHSTRAVDVHVGFHVSEQGLKSALAVLKKAEEELNEVEAEGAGGGVGGFDMEVGLVVQELRLVIRLMQVAAGIGLECGATHPAGHLCDLARLRPAPSQRLAEELGELEALLREVWTRRNKAGGGLEDTIMRVKHTVAVLAKEPLPVAERAAPSWLSQLLAMVTGGGAAREEEL